MAHLKKGLLERLAEGVVVGDGSFILTMEKRGYATAGAWTPEACILHPEAGTHCILALPTGYTTKMCLFSFKHCWFFNNVTEAEWAIETMVESGVPVACTMRVPPSGDRYGVSVAECAVRMAKAGAGVVGVNCIYDPTISLKSIASMKKGLQEAGLQTYLMVQPLGYHTQDPGMEENHAGYIVLPQWPFAMEPRALTRIEAHRFAREAYELGVRYIGGCCGFEPHHIKAIAEELAEERGRLPPSAGIRGSWKSLGLSHLKQYAEKTNWKYWDNLEPTAGRDIGAFSELMPAD